MKKINTESILKIKQPDLTADILDILKKRFSPRWFLDVEVAERDIKSMFQGARWAPSAFNAQPWFFYWAQKNTEGFKKPSSCLMEGNAWAKHAPLLILGCYISKTDHGENPYAPYDLGQSVMSLVVQAQSLGYYVHQMAGFDREKAKKLLSVTASLVPFVMIAVGKLGDYQKANEKMIKRDYVKRERKVDVEKRV